MRKEGGFPIRTTKEDNRNLHPFLIPAELAFAKLTYRYDASYDDSFLADPDVGKAFDENVARVGRSDDLVAYRLAALHLRKNVRSRRRADAEHLATTLTYRRSKLIGTRPDTCRMSYRAQCRTPKASSRYGNRGAIYI